MDHLHGVIIHPANLCHSAHWEDAPTELVLDVSLNITNSIIEVDSESNQYGTEAKDGQVNLRAFDTARAIVDSFAYAAGLGPTVVLDNVTKPDGIKYDIREKRPDLAALVTAFHSGPEDTSIELASMLPIVFSDTLVFMALNDLVASISLPHHAPVNCGRVIEAIRELMTPLNGDRKQAWLAMRDSLNIDQGYLEFITNQSKGPGHGDRRSVTYPSFQETIKRSWIVMNRFLEFRKRGNQRLPLGEFPPLTN
jgi:hypothetical protein